MIGTICPVVEQDQVNATINASETLEARIQSGYGDTVLDRVSNIHFINPQECTMMCHQNVF